MLPSDSRQALASLLASDCARKVRLRNFRGFDDHVVPLRDLTIIVGENNAGKSTIVEALRLAALAVNRFRRGGSQFVGS